MPAENTTCTAKWNPGGVTYTVQYWQENANDTDYSYFERVEKQAQAGSKVSGSGDKTYAGFTFAHADANVVVKGDGSTVVNVYYKRNVYEVRFMNGKVICEQKEHSHNHDECCTRTGWHKPVSYTHLPC